MNPTQKRVLWACIESWRNSHMTETAREICYEWVLPTYQERFNDHFHQAVLKELAKMGYLKEGDRGERLRRYYTIPNVQRAEEAIKMQKIPA